MSKMGPALRALVNGMEEGRIRPLNKKAKLKTLTTDGKPRRKRRLQPIELMYS